MALNYDSPTEIRRLLEARGWNALRRWGQNFLINKKAREKILEALEPVPGERVWEVGPGLGAMTTLILDAGCPLTVFEIDPGYVDYLAEEFGDRPGFRVVEGDVVKTWRTQLEQEPCDRVVGNLPYNAASAIIGSFIENQFVPGIFVTTVQKEMAQRMTAEVGSKNYSSFSVLCQSAFTLKTVGDLKPGNFFPAPEVTSSVVQLRRAPVLDVPDRKRFHTLVRELFSSRRKTLKNNLPRTAQALGVELEALEACFVDQGIDPRRRAETLEIAEFAALARGLGR